MRIQRSLKELKKNYNNIYKVKENNFQDFTFYLTNNFYKSYPKLVIYR